MPFDPVTTFVQLHGFDASPLDMAEIGDGTTNDEAPDSVSVRFANHLGASVPTPATVLTLQFSVSCE